MFAISPQLSKILLAFLLLLPAFSLYIKILSPHLTQTSFDGFAIICAEIIFIIFIAIFGKHLSSISRQGYYLIAAILSWHIIGVVSAVLSDHFYASIIKQIEYATHCLFAYSAWIFLSQTRKQEKTAYFLIFTFIWVIYYILAAWHSSPNAFELNWVSSTPMFNNIRHLGYLQIGILPILFLPLLSNRRHNTLITLLLLSVFWSSVIWACSRGTFFGALIVTVLLAIYFKELRKKILLLSVITLIFGSIIALQFPSQSPSLDPYRLLFLNFDDLSEIDVSKLSAGRTDIWGLSIVNVWQHNIFFGVGADGFRYATPQINPQVVQPHNSVIQALYEFGLVGVIALLLTVVTCIKIWRKHSGSLVNKIARFSLLAVLIGSMIDGHFHHSFSLLLIAIYSALAFAKTDNKKKNNKSTALILLTLAIAFIWPLKQHLQTYLEQQLSLFNDYQLSQIESFPSYYFPMKWILEPTLFPELRKEAIIFGQKHSPKKCNYFLIEYSESKKIEHTTKLLSDIKQVCTKHELTISQDPTLMKLALEVSR